MPSNAPPPLPPAETPRELAVAVVRRLTEAGHRALFAGGCVRDTLLGRPAKDFDVATSAKPDEVRALFRRTLAVGAAFGVICVLEEKVPQERAPRQIEVATFRSDGAYTDGRRPDSVQFTTEVEDVKRRDFTINGLLYDPLKDEVLDYVGGRDDLARKVVRAIGDANARFAEDRLRMLRAVRFAAAFGFELDSATRDAIRASASHVLQVSPERIREELVKMLTGPRPRQAFELLESTGLLAAVLPEVAALKGVEQPPEFHPEGDVWTHTLLLLGQLENASATLALGALLHDIGKPATFQKADRIRFNDHEKVGAALAEELLRRLKFSNDDLTRICALVKQHMTFKDVKQMRMATLKKFMRQPHFSEHLELHRLDCLACHKNLANYEFVKQKLGETAASQLRPKPLLSGDDLQALGFTPGPQLGKIIAALEEEQLEGRLDSPEAARAWVCATFLK